MNLDLQAICRYWTERKGRASPGGSVRAPDKSSVSRPRGTGETRHDRGCPSYGHGVGFHGFPFNPTYVLWDTCCPSGALLEDTVET